MVYYNAIYNWVGNVIPYITQPTKVFFIAHVLQLGCSSSAGSAGGAIGFTAKPVVSANPRTKSCLRGYDDMSCQILQVSSL